MAEFYSARSWEIPPLPWTNLSPPFSSDRGQQRAGVGRRCGIARFGIVYAVGIERGVVGIVRGVDEIEHLGPPVVGVETPPAGNSLSRLGRVALLPALLKLSGVHRAQAGAFGDNARRCPSPRVFPDTISKPWSSTGSGTPVSQLRTPAMPPAGFVSRFHEQSSARGVDPSR